MFQALDGQNIYSGCCTLRIEFSRLESLNVKFNNEKSRDFTRNDLPSGSEYILGLSSPVHPNLSGKTYNYINMKTVNHYSPVCNLWFLINNDLNKKMIPLPNVCLKLKLHPSHKRPLK